MKIVLAVTGGASLRQSEKLLGSKKVNDKHPTISVTTFNKLMNHSLAHSKVFLRFSLNKMIWFSFRLN